jgi:hypothetical protein
MGSYTVQNTRASRYGNVLEAIRILQVSSQVLCVGDSSTAVVCQTWLTIEVCVDNTAAGLLPGGCNSSSWPFGGLGLSASGGPAAVVCDWFLLGKACCAHSGEKVGFAMLLAMA